jgi:hypothetical protein
MEINNQSITQSGLSPLYPQTQQELNGEARNAAETENPVEDTKEGSNQQPQPRTDNNQPQQNGRVDTYA